jgi:protocatechuate 3,4-dioxygenase alpha subunit
VDLTPDHKPDRTPTPSQTVGPFFHLGCTDNDSVGSLVTATSKGERIRLICRVLDGNGAPVPDAMIEIWQANAAGRYNHPDDTQEKTLDPGFSGFGRLSSDADGACTFETIKPGCVAGTNGKEQSPHINVSVFARGVLKRLATRTYFAGDPSNAEDGVLALAPQERRNTLMAQPDAGNTNEWRFDIYLCGENETVFFDV